MKIKIIVAVLLAVCLEKNVFAQTDADNPIDMLKTTIVHGVPFERTQNVRNFLSALSGSPTFAHAFAKEVVEEGGKEKIHLTYTYRGNLIEFVTTTDSLKITYQVWLDPKLSSDARDIQYYDATGKSHFKDEWLYPNRLVTLSAADNLSDFISHAKMAAWIMKGGLYVPHGLSSRLSYNMRENKAYANLFIDILDPLFPLMDKIVTEDGVEELIVDNGDRAYTVISGYKPETTFEVFPKWGR